MRTFGTTAMMLALATTIAGAQTPPTTSPTPVTPQAQPAPQVQPAPAAPREMPSASVLSSLPADAATITHWYKQAVYDLGNNKIGDIEDVLLDRDSKVVALVIGVGGFLGIGEKHVAVPQNMVRATTKDNNKWHLVMNSTKDSLKSAPGFKYDRTAMVWMPENAPVTTGSSPSRK